MNLLMLSVDSLRWDAVARTHPHLMATPRFDRIAEVFSYTNRCFSVSTATRPVHQSVFSGLFPFEHGITGQHRRQRRRVEVGGRRHAAISPASTTTDSSRPLALAGPTSWRVLFMKGLSSTMAAARPSRLTAMG